MAVNVQYDNVMWIEVGLGAAAPNRVTPNNIVSLAERVISPDGDMIYPMQFINELDPVGVHHNHKAWEIEFTLDTDWVFDSVANPLNTFMYYMASHAGPHYPIECGAENGQIDRFRAYLREGGATETLIVYSAGTDERVWCVGEVADFSNEIGHRRQTMTWTFIALRNPIRTLNQAAGTWTRTPSANEAAITVLRIDSVEINGDICTNVLRYKDEYRMQMTPRFMPNTFRGLDMKQDQKWRVLTVVVDSETDIFDAYFDVEAANALIADDIIVNLTLADAAGGTLTWTYDGGTPEVSYILNRRLGLISNDLPRDTIEYQILTTCDKDWS